MVKHIHVEIPLVPPRNFIRYDRGCNICLAVLIERFYGKAPSAFHLLLNACLALISSYDSDFSLHFVHLSFPIDKILLHATCCRVLL